MTKRSPCRDRWNRVAERKSGDATGRPNELASFLGHAGAKFLVKNWEGAQRKKQGAKKKEGGPVETDAAQVSTQNFMPIRHPRAC
jgi:hypothetical protein